MDQQESQGWQGRVTRVFYSNAEAPFAAGLLRCSDGQTVRFAGKIAVEAGDELEITGRWYDHPQHGMQVQVETGIVRMDESPAAMEHMLASNDCFKGIGPAKAEKIVSAALTVGDGDFSGAMDRAPRAVADLAVVDVELIEKASGLWEEKRGHYTAVADLVRQGWSNGQAEKISKRFGPMAPKIVQEDPYRLVGRVSRFGFRTVDAVAREMGVASDNPSRIFAGVGYCLDQIANDGHTWTTRRSLAAAAESELQPDTLDGERKILEAIQKLIDEGAVVVNQAPSGEEIVADAALAKTELKVFDWLISGIQENDRVRRVDVEPSILNSLNMGQRRAILGVTARRRVSIISGGAGVGKTYAMRTLCDIAKQNGMSVALCAPTGKAARRLSEATGRSASTIHRLLRPQYDPVSMEFRFAADERSPIEASLVICDEVSMVDVRLMWSLLRALKPSTRLLLVGDHNQIPSVGPGAILRDVLRFRDKFPEAIHVLDEIMRQSGALARNTTAILDGVVCMDSSPVWFIHRTERGCEESLAEWICMMVERVATATDALPTLGKVDYLWDVQVLSPMRKGRLGTWALNAHIQQLRQRLLGNPPPPEAPQNKPPKPLPGDKIIWMQNDYSLHLLNGSQGVVVEALKGGGVIIETDELSPDENGDCDMAENGKRRVRVPPDMRDRMELAYAITYHKSQGAQWPYVIMIASSLHQFMHDRNLMYTGAARASRALTILGDRSGMMHFARTKRSDARQTFGSLMNNGWGAPLSQAQGAVVEEVSHEDVG